MSGAASAQTGPWARVAATVVTGFSRAGLTPLRTPGSAAWVEQPVVMVRGGVGERLTARVTLNLEGLSMPNGVVTPGGFGEGWFDKRHPHTYLHELIVSGRVGGPRAGASLSLGKGFVAFGSDDPMNRPALRFPVNHHFSQIVERAVVVGGILAGPVVIEGTLFNGDEPERPGQFPKIDRLGDSWAARVTARPATGAEVQGSYARVKSPEHRPGFGPTQGKMSASARVVRRVRAWTAYAHAEWARTTDVDGFFVYHSVLAEAEIRAGAHRPYYRFERTERPEEERLLDPFRSVRPHLDDNIIGITRWTIHTIGYGLDVPVGGWVRAEPFVEIAYGVAADVGGGLFRPREFYGDDRALALSVGVRVGYGLRHRMGRYGVLASHAQP